MSKKANYKPRSEKNADRRAARNAQAESDAKRFIDELAAPVYLDPDRFKDDATATKWADDACTRIEQQFKVRTYKWHAARERLAKQTHSMNVQYGLHIPVKPPPIHTVRPNSSKDEAMFEQGTCVYPIAEKFLARLDDPIAMSDFKNQDMLPLILFSCACFGGLVDRRALFALAQHLQGGLIRLNWEPHRNNAWLEVTFKTKKANNFFDADGRPMCLRRWQPDGRTLPLLLKYVNTHPPSRQYANEKSLMKKMREALAKFTGLTLPVKMSLKQLCDGAAFVFEEQADISQYLLDCALGKTDWVSCLPTYYKAYIGASYKVPDAPQTPEVSTQPRQTVNPKPDPNIAYEYERMKRLFEKGDGPNKHSGPDLVSGLEEIRDSTGSLNTRLLCEWLLHVFARSNVRSENTPKRYLAEIGMLWFIEFNGIDLRTLSADAFFEKYETAIESKNENGRSYAAGRFDDFHRFLSVVHGYPPLPSELRHGYSGTKMVRPRLISEHLFQTFLETLQASDCSEVQKSHFTWIFILCFRLGIRIGEACQLSFVDIEVNDRKNDPTVADSAFIFIRNNNHGNTKSRRALQLPLSVMLTPNEFSHFQTWYNKHRAAGSSERDALFPGDTNHIWKTTDLSHLFSMLMHQISGLHYSPHDCRHSVACRLHCISEGLTPLDGGCYDSEHTELVREKLFTRDIDARDKIWHLTGVFNHADPSTTFQSYLHLHDWIIANKLAAEGHTFAIQSLRALFPDSKATYTSNGDGRIDVEDLRVVLLSRARHCVDVVKVEPIENRVFGDYTPPPTQGPDRVQLIYRLLYEYENGDDIETVSLRHQVPVSFINTVVCNAEALAQLLTRQLKPRLFSAKRLETNSFPLTPTPLHEFEDKKWALQLIRGLRTLYKRDEERIRWMLRHWLLHSHTSDSVIPFHTPADQKKFARCLVASGAVKASDICIQIRPPEGRSQNVVLKEWDIGGKVSLSKDSVKNRKLYPSGIAYLSLLSRAKDWKSKEGAQRQSRASKMPRWVFHMLAILLGLGKTLSDEVELIDGGKVRDN